jgi:hypothetical protein
MFNRASFNMQVLTGAYRTAWTMSEPANVLIDQGKIDAAFDLYTQSMEVHLKVLGPTQPQDSSLLQQDCLVPTETRRIQNGNVHLTLYSHD